MFFKCAWFLELRVEKFWNHFMGTVQFSTWVEVLLPFELQLLLKRQQTQTWSHKCVGGVILWMYICVCGFVSSSSVHWKGIEATTILLVTSIPGIQVLAAKYPLLPKGIRNSGETTDSRPRTWKMQNEPVMSSYAPRRKANPNTMGIWQKDTRVSFQDNFIIRIDKDNEGL